MSWIQRILGATPKAAETPSPSTGFVDMDGKPQPLAQSALDSRTARELIHAAAVRTAASFGIPSNWLKFEVITISNDAQAYFQLQVGLRVWDEQLWSQAAAFEQQALKQVRLANAKVARAVRAVLWRILPDAGCPYDELSGEQAWLPDAVKARARAYDRLRADLAAPLPATVPTAAKAEVPSATQPMVKILESQFSDTYSAAPTGFEATRPFTLDELAQARQTKK